MNQSTNSSKKSKIQGNSSKMVSKNLLGNVAFDLVNELLETVLLKKNKTIEIQSKDFRHSIGKGIENIGFLKINISKDIVVEIGKKVEITLDGTIENERGQQETFTFFFFMWRDDQNILSNFCSKRKSLESQSLLVKLGEQKRNLPDAVFDLTLYTKKEQNRQNVLGKGRGFLVFGLPQNSRAN